MANVGLIPHDEHCLKKGDDPMAASGLFPYPDDKPSVRVPKERLAEFDRVWAEGKVEALVKALEKKKPSEEEGSCLA